MNSALHDDKDKQSQVPASDCNNLDSGTVGGDSDTGTPELWVRCLAVCSSRQRRRHARHARGWVV